MLRRLKRETLRERIVEEVKRAIIEGDLKPGDRLPTEMELAESLGVSRSSVREATKALEFIGVLNSSPKNGCTVGNFDMRGVVDQLRFHLEAHQASLADMLDARMLLEVGIIPMVTSRATDDELSELHELVSQMGKKLETGEEEVELDMEFHSALFQMARNKVLESFSNVIEEFFIHLRDELPANQKDPKSAFEQHKQIAEALQVRDTAAAQAAMIRHLELVRKEIEHAKA